MIPFDRKELNVAIDVIEREGMVYQADLLRHLVDKVAGVVQPPSHRAVRIAEAGSMLHAIIVNTQAIMDFSLMIHQDPFKVADAIMAGIVGLDRLGNWTPSLSRAETLLLIPEAESRKFQPVDIPDGFVSYRPSVRVICPRCLPMQEASAVLGDPFEYSRHGHTPSVVELHFISVSDGYGGDNNLGAGRCPRCGIWLIA
jgi:hypothetical protein